MVLIEIDGSQKGGSGTILRLAVALAAIRKQPLHIYNIRQNRPHPGLKRQHLEAVITASKLCDAELQGAEIDSREIWFKPNELKGGRIQAEIGTAGSIPMLLMTVLPICACADSNVDLHVSKGGTDVTHSPTINYMRFVFLPTLERIGIKSRLIVQKYGYYPKGNGEVTMIVEPSESLRPLQLENHGMIKAINGVSVCTFLSERKVAERQARAATDYLSKRGLTANIQIINDNSNPLQKGSSLVLWAETDSGVILGADSIGELKKSSETVGREAAERLFTEISSKPTVDVHLADLLIPYVALAQGKSTFLTRKLTEHLDTNIWIVEKILAVKFSTERYDGLFRIEKSA